MDHFGVPVCKCASGFFGPRCNLQLPASMASILILDFFLFPLWFCLYKYISTPYIRTQNFEMSLFMLLWNVIRVLVFYHWESFKKYVAEKLLF